MNALRFWQILLVNWLFFTGMALGGVVFSAILEVTGSHWGRPFKRLAEAFAAFIPVSLLIFIALYFGADDIYPWAAHPVPGREWWLAKNLWFARDLAILLIMFGTALIYLRASILPDLKNDPAVTARFLKQRVYLAPAVIIIYGLCYPMLAYDLVMSIVPGWYSTLFGAYVAVINIFGALGLIAAVAVFLGKRLGIRDALTEPQFHDLGKLTFGFCILSMDFFWSQFLVIWYGNLPEETSFVMVRAFNHPWSHLSWTVLFGTFVAPFILLLRRRMKTRPRRLAAVGVWITVMIFLERFLLVAPSAWPGKDLPFGVIEIAVTAVVAAAFFAALLITARRIPMLPISDPLLDQAGFHHHYIGEPDYMPGDPRPAGEGGPA